VIEKSQMSNEGEGKQNVRGGSRMIYPKNRKRGEKSEELGEEGGRSSRGRKSGQKSVGVMGSGRRRGRGRKIQGKADRAKRRIKGTD